MDKTKVSGTFDSSSILLGATKGENQNYQLILRLYYPVKHLSGLRLLESQIHIFGWIMPILPTNVKYDFRKLIPAINLLAPCEKKSKDK
jgi:hypothetical protein